MNTSWTLRRPENLKSDILAGLTLAALGIPEVMGYTKIIGTPVITGLYTMLFPMLVFAWLGSSRHLVVGADSATASIVASALAALSVFPDQYVGMTSLVALMAGGMLLAARLLRLGFLANFLSRTVLVGFLTGVGFQVALNQLHGLLGLQKMGTGFLSGLWLTLLNVPQAHLLSVAIAGAVLVFIYVMHKTVPRFPAALLIVTLMIGISYFFALGEHGVQVVGAVPAGLPHLEWPKFDLAQVLSLFSVAFSCSVVILAQSAATSRAYANRYQEDFSEEADLLGLSAANLVAALTGTFVVNGSPTKTAIVDGAGGRSQWAHVVCALAVLLVLLFLTAPLSYLPEAALAAIVFHIGFSLIDFKGLRDIARNNRIEFWLALLTAGTVLIFGVMQGILLAIVLSLLYHVQRSYQPTSSILVRKENGTWMPTPVTAAESTVPGFLVYWFGADLFYANAGHFVSEIQRLVRASTTPPRWLVVDAGAITGIDYSATRALFELGRFLAERKIRCVWVHVSPGFLADLKAQGLLEQDLLFATLHDALHAYPDAGRVKLPE